MRLGALLCAGVVAGVSGACSVEPIALDVTFATRELRRRATVVEVTIGSGTCAADDDGRSRVFAATGAPTATIEAPGRLAPGAYAFRASARDRECRVFARGCRDVRLPMRDDASIEVLLGHVSVEATCTTRERCVAGRCEPMTLPSWQCPAGWRTSTLDDPTIGSVPTCEPFPRGDGRCEGNTAQLPGDAECLPIGTDCAAAGPDGWPRGITTPATFVREGEVGGDGTRDRPYGDLVSALRDAPASGLVVASGTFTLDGSSGRPLGLVVDRGITLRGVCPGTTVLRLATPVSSDTPADGEIRCDGRCTLGAVELRGGAALHDLSVERGGPAVWVRGDAALRDVVVTEAVGFGVFVETGVTLDASGLLLRGIRFAPGEAGALVGGGNVTIAGLAADGNEVPSIRLYQMNLSLTRATVLGTILAIQGSHGRLDQVVVETSGTAVFADGATVRVRDGIVRSTSHAVAVEVHDRSATFELLGGRIEGGVAVASESDLAALALGDVVIAPTQEQPTVLDIVGADVVRLERTLITGGSQCAVRAERADALAWRDGVVARSPVALCVEQGTTSLDRCNVRVFETIREVRGERGATPAEVCNGCDDDGDGDATDSAASCPASEVDERGACAEVATTDEREAGVTSWRCCLDAIGARPCLGLFGVEIVSDGPDGASVRRCCTW